ncbi:MAG: YetF domain-containing protein, partial [Solibacillus isronensis]
LNSWLILKNKKLRDFIEGDPSLVIRDGFICEMEMKKQRYNLDDLLQQLREQGVCSVQDVAYAFLEQSGKLSIYQKNQGGFILPLILDGYVDKRHLKIIGKDEEWLVRELLVNGYPNIRDIFYCSYEDGKWFVQLRARKN